MCDFSLQSVRSRPAKVGDKLVTRDFGTGTRGFSASEDPGMAVCILPGTELAFTGDVACLPAGLLGWKTKTINHQTAIFRQVNKDKMAAHHDAVEFPDGRSVLLTLLCEGQETTVLQLPAQPRNEDEARELERRGIDTLIDRLRPGQSTAIATGDRHMRRGVPVSVEHPGTGQDQYQQSSRDQYNAPIHRRRFRLRAAERLSGPR